MVYISKEPVKVKLSNTEILKKIREHIRKGTYVLREHAIQRQKDRQVRLPDLLYALEHGRHEQNMDVFDIKNQCWKHAIRGRTIDHVDLRVNGDHYGN